VRQPHRPDRWAVALRQERLSQGLTLREFGLLIGYAYASSVAHIESGRKATTQRARARIEAALGKRLAT
jgi:transcriptional regulator with XRE-family HTH domain